ncbi:MAG: hypothetical protein J5494_01880, partial [Candidatus Methanomethylophilaceae archaeon]|nr:hypothetical protein [Candidatus Methanomethylophilaceae archaeon]
MSGKALTLIALLAVLAAAVCVAETCDASGSFSGEFRQNAPCEHPGEPFSGPHEGPGHAGSP